MVVRPAREARIFKEGHSIRLSRKRGSFAIASVGKLFNRKASDETTPPAYRAVKKIQPIITDSFDTVDLESLQKQPTKYLSFDPFKNLEKKVHVRTPRHVWAITFSLFFLIISLYSFELFYQTHLLLGTKIAGQNLSFKTREQADYALRANIQKFSTTLKVGDQSLTPTANDLGIRFEVERTLNAVFVKQQRDGIFSHLQLWANHDTDITVSVDTDRFTRYFDQFKQYNSEPTRDALVRIKNENVDIVPEISGQVRGFKDPYPEALKAATKLQPVILQQETYLESPLVTKDRLERIRPQIEKIINTPIHFKQDTYSFAPSKEVVARWLVFTGSDNLGISIDETQVLAYLDSVAKQHLTTPHPTVSSTVNGVTKELSRGSNGFDFADKSLLIANITSALKEGSPLRYEVPIESVMSPTITAGDTPKWLDVNLTSHLVTAYSYQDKLRTIPFSAGTSLEPTVRGNFTIYKKERKQDRYTSGIPSLLPNVEYVSYFYRDFAFESSPWLPLTTFGVSDSSHGSIDIMPQDAAWLFDWSAIGTAVVIHD
jgi:lipoprotein-anchoring transpeptidase ErfK/SrfK